MRTGPRSSLSVIFLFSAALLVLGGLGFFFWHQPAPPQGLGDRTQWLAQGPSLPPFSLPSTQGTLTQESLSGHWTFLLFGYTHCPDVCPTDLALLASVSRSFKRSGHPAPQVLFVSVDPQRDSLSVLGRYIPAFDPSFIGAQATTAQLSPFTQSLGVYAVLHNQERDGRGNYAVDHSSTIFLFNPSGRLQASFQVPQTPDQLFHETQAILEN
ncbi:SCO family protein [Ferrovum myxofaciens]|uniref:SCO family protein n=1 Tax=Ferrovum myxofaciens TaxID=416213 RepID=UPI00068CB02A|nr:SCO family protein [Ferrovum myxofaciens]MBW8028933.1 SCO family protein [Ferrovum sp.]